MVNIFEIITKRLADLGVFSFFLPWLITAALFYGLLRKTKIFESVALNAILSLSISFLIWGYLITPFAFELGKSLSIFIAQAFVIIIVFLFALLGASMFYPKFGDVIAGDKERTMIWVFIAIFIGALFFTSGMYKVLIIGPSVAGPGGDVATMVLILSVLIVGILILVGVSRSMGGKKGE